MASDEQLQHLAIIVRDLRDSWAGFDSECAVAVEQEYNYLLRTIAEIVRKNRSEDKR